MIWCKTSKIYRGKMWRETSSAHAQYKRFDDVGIVDHIYLSLSGRDHGLTEKLILNWIFIRGAAMVLRR